MNTVVAVSGALAAFAALLVAIITYKQLKHSRFALGADLILRLEASFFEAVEMKADRSRAASALKRGSDAGELEPVLDFFETVGLLVRREVVDKELAWNSFSYWVLRYAALAGNQIKVRRKKEHDPTYYQEFDFLVECLTQVEIEKRHLKSRPSFSKELLDGFLGEEIG